MKKLLIIIIVIVLLNVFYYFYSTCALKNIWDYTQGVMKFEIEPEKSSPIHFLYNDKMIYPNTASVDLKIRRYLIFRFGNKAHWSAHYERSFYDEDGYLIKSYSDDIVFCFENNGSEWVISEICLYT